MRKGNIVINCIALLIAALFLVLPLIEPKKGAQYDIVFLGDSIIGNVNNDGSITDIVSEKLGKRVFNGAFGGTTLSFNEDMLWGSVTSRQWCMVKLADAIAYRDWQSQLATMEYADYYRKVNAQALYYFEERMQNLSKIDFEQVEVLVIEHGTNDYNCGCKLDNPKDLYDITTFGGAIRYSLKALQEAYPNMQIVLLSPIYCELGVNRENPCYSYDFGYGTLDDYVQLEMQIAEEFGVPYIDAYNGSGIWEDNAEEYLFDGLHLTQAGITLMGNFIADELMALDVE